MSDLTFNKIAGAALATGLVIVGLTQLTKGVFEQEQPKTPGYAVEVAEGAAEGGAPVVDTLPDWGTVLPTADVAAGEAVFAKCKSCHTAEAGGPNGTGPNLHGVMGEAVATGHGGYAFSDALRGKGGTWDWDTMNAWLTSPRAFAPGTRMTFGGLANPQERADLLLYLNAQGGHLTVPPPPAAAPAGGNESAGNTANAAAPAAGNAAAPAAANAAAPAAH